MWGNAWRILASEAPGDSSSQTRMPVIFVNRLSGKSLLYNPRSNRAGACTTETSLVKQELGSRVETEGFHMHRPTPPQGNCQQLPASHCR